MYIFLCWILSDCFVCHSCLTCETLLTHRSVHRHVARSAAMGFIGAVAVKLRPAGTGTSGADVAAPGRAHLLRPFLVTLLQPLVRATEARSTSSDYVRLIDSSLLRPPFGYVKITYLAETRLRKVHASKYMSIGPCASDL